MFRLVVFLSVLACIFSSPFPNEKRLPVPWIAGVNGLKASHGQFPYQLNLIHEGESRCGAVLISENFALTAAHCTYKEPPSAFKIIAGTIFRTRYDDDGVKVQVDRIEEHPQYDDLTQEFDIAVLFWFKSLTYSRTVSAIRLANADDVVPEGAKATVSGWGYEDDINDKPELLKFDNQPMWKQSECDAFVGQYQKFKGPILCTGEKGKISGPCSGDSGGPLVYKNKLFGIVSLGYGCGASPHVFASVPGLRNWIANVTKV